MKTTKETFNKVSIKENLQGGKLNEGQEKGNNKVVVTPKPIIAPAPQKPKNK